MPDVAQFALNCIDTSARGDKTRGGKRREGTTRGHSLDAHRARRGGQHEAARGDLEVHGDGRPDLQRPYRQDSLPLLDAHLRAAVQAAPGSGVASSTSRVGALGALTAYALR